MDISPDKANFSDLKLISRTLSEQMGMTEQEIVSRKEILKITPAHEKALNKCADYISLNTPFLVEAFYDEQTKIKDIELLIGDADTLVRLQGSMVNYIHSLFGGTYDMTYVSSRLRIGLVHKRIGVSPKLYLCGMQTLNEILVSAINDFYMSEEDKSDCGKAVEGLERLLSFDIGLVFDTYIRSLTAEIEVGKEVLENHAKGLEATIKERTRELAQLALHDPLTGLQNQRAFYDDLNKTLGLSKRYNHTVALVYMDLDGFKKLNDKDGHVAGDKALKQLAEAINLNLRDTDSAARYGGDEFCIIMPNTDLIAATVFCERLNTDFAEIINNNELSISTGIAQSGPAVHIEAKELVKIADKNMYKAKEAMGYTIVVDRVEKENEPPARELNEEEVARMENLNTIKLAEIKTK